MVKMKNMDIDQLLDDTIELTDEDISYLITFIEIDVLLEVTEDW